MGNVFDMPTEISTGLLTTDPRSLTLPSAQAFILSNGKFDLWMDVVHIQCGSPRQATTAQKAMMIQRRVFTIAGDSGGGVGLTL